LFDGLISFRMSSYKACPSSLQKTLEAGIRKQTELLKMFGPRLSYSGWFPLRASFFEVVVQGYPVTYLTPKFDAYPLGTTISTIIAVIGVVSVARPTSATNSLHNLGRLVLMHGLLYRP